MANNVVSAWVEGVVAQARQSTLARTLLHTAKAAAVPTVRVSALEELEKCMNCTRPEARNAGYWEPNGPEGEPGKWHGPGPEPPPHEEQNSGEEEAEAELPECPEGL